MKYKHQKYQGGMLMASYIGMYTRNKKGIKIRIKTIIGLYGKGNEIISWCLLCVGSCLVSSNYQCMHCHLWNMLHQIYTSRIGNDNVCQGSKIVSSDDNIHSSSCVAGEKVKNLSLYMSFILQCNSCIGISKRIMGWSALIPTRTT
jgi:hypothetical protein